MTIEMSQGCLCIYTLREIFNFRSLSSILTIIYIYIVLFEEDDWKIRLTVGRSRLGN